MKKTRIIRAGLDVGGTLAKIVVEEATGQETFKLFPSKEIDSIIPLLKQAEEAGITGGGAAEISEHLSTSLHHVSEFNAWSAGANILLDSAQVQPYLLVSVGTGTSAMLVTQETVKRVGGTALGGGTLLGLAAAMLKVYDFEELCKLASQGERNHVDLRVRDIYRNGGMQLKEDLTAASFAKLARESGLHASQEDLAAALMGLVGENVALICGGLASQYNVEKVVYGGAALRNNPTLRAVLISVTCMLEKEPYILHDGEFAGAIGALKLIEQGER